MANAFAPINSDGRYYWYGNAAGVTGGQINFVGDLTNLTGKAALTWQILQRATDSSYPVLTYSTNLGATSTSLQLGPEGTPQQTILESGEVVVDMTGATGFNINLTSAGGAVVTGAKQWIVGLAITRNITEGPAWDTPNPFDPISYNASRLDLNGYPMATLVQLRGRLMQDLGFSAQAANPPPSMTAFLNNKLLGAQNFLFRRYQALHMKRFFRWKLIPGQRFYSLADNDEDPLSSFKMDPLKQIEWAGIQDTRNVWYPLMEGIPPQLYTMIDKTWRPARYDIRQCLEIYPAPDQTYWMWMKANFGLMSFVNDSDQTTLDSELVYLFALANCKAHYGQPDAQNYAQMANTYRGELIAGSHGTKKYIPNTVAVPPAVRPVLIGSDGQSIS